MASRRKILALIGIATTALATGLLTGGVDIVDGEHGEAPVAPDSGWDRLSLPLEVRDGGAFLATDDQILLFGGCGARPKYDCRPTRDGFAYSPATDRWTRIPEAPFAPLGASVWTGEEAIFLNTGTAYKQPGTARSVRGLAFAPDDETWRRLPRAPLRLKGSDAVWTGTEVIVWGGGGRWSPAAANGAAYDPAIDRWRKIARAPISIDNVNLTWTGTEMIAFGSRLDHRNHASTRVAIGATYDPASDSWRRIADSKLSPQADTTAWAGGRMVSYDYAPDYQSYDPTNDTWSPKRPMPLRFAECYPDSSALPNGVFANFCGQVAVYDSASRHWSKITGGMTRRKLRGYRVNFWGQASLAVLDGSAYLLATGYSRKPNETPLEFPRSFWSYTPAPATASPSPRDGLTRSSRPMDARHLYVGVSCDTGNEIGCDGIRLSVEVPGEPDYVEANVDGYRTKLTRIANGKNADAIYQGRLRKPGLLHEGPLAVDAEPNGKWMGPPVRFPMSLRAVFRDEGTFTEQAFDDVPLYPGFG